MRASGHWKKKKRAPLVTGEVYLRASGYCAGTVGKKSSSNLLLLPLRCKRSKQWGPCTVNPVFFFTKQFISAVYLKRSRSRVNKRTSGFNKNNFLRSSQNR